MVANMAEDPEREEEPPVTQFSKNLAASGGGSGVALHIDAEIAREFNLDVDTEVDVQFREEEGELQFVVTPDNGFTRPELEDHAEQHGWRLKSESTFGDHEWHRVYRDSEEQVRIEVNSDTRIGDAVVNNVTIASDAVEIQDEALNRYDQLCAVATRKGLRVEINDSAGLWQRLRSSPEHETHDAPDSETFAQLLERANKVTIRLVRECSSLKTTLDEVSQTVNTIQSAMDTLST